ncbi:MAG: pyridoxamine 5'-phosphate oxidase family protein [Sphingomonadaceae bacterium]|nr:pyridoxamine 5'-phosphate oxidase family protein [Sphingomonadaceae bacterium]
MAGNPYFNIAFTPKVMELQSKAGSRDAYARQGPRPGGNAALRAEEIAFIAERNGFYLASVSETGWPYVQFRGGPRGFVKPIGPTQLGWADFRGNQQFQTAGYVEHDERVSLFFMDYNGKRRLKIYGRLRFLDARCEPEWVEQMKMPEYRATIDRIALVEIAAWDRNCPQHISVPL